MRDFQQLSYHERERIYMGIRDGKSQKQIGEELGRPRCTISREVCRNSDQMGYLYAGVAHKMAQDRKNKNKPKVDKNIDLKTYILEKLRERWSPKAISGRWNAEHAHQKISTETIYRWIYSEEGEKLGLKKLLVRARKKRGIPVKPATVPKIKDRVSVHERPDHINQRLEFGHWEGDLMFNSGSQSENICSLVERVTRCAILIKNQTKNTKEVLDALIDHIVKTGIVVKSITFDNGGEFFDHTRLNQMGIKTYFCDPRSPWQKASIEHLNSVTRRFFPFEREAKTITQQEVEIVCQKINDMPREILDFRTANEVFNQACLGIAL